jgi:hypothetical protein
MPQARWIAVGQGAKRLLNSGATIGQSPSGVGKIRWRTRAITP